MSDVRETPRSDERPFDGRRDEVRDDAGLVLHEERLRAGVERIEGSRVEVRKRIVTEEVTVAVPVRREVVDVVRVYPDGSEEALDVPPSHWEPRLEKGDGDAAGHTPRDGGVHDTEQAEREARSAHRGDGRHDIVLHEERPVVTTRVYAFERLRLDVTGEQQIVPVSAEVRREVVDVDATDGLLDGETGTARR